MRDLNNLNREHDDKLKKQKTLWQDNYIQFARLISELDVVGAFTKDVLKKLEDEMSLDKENIFELIDRAKYQFDKTKENL